MDQDAVVKEALTEGMKKAGADLTQRLDEVGWPVLASLWLYLPDSKDWKLLLASPEVAEKGPKEAYEIIQKALGDSSKGDIPIPLSDIGVTEPRNPLIALLSTAVRTGPTIGGIRFTRNVINGHFIEDAYIYRISDRPPTGGSRLTRA